ncbi:MAG: VWA domain-containing protein [Leptospirales bacterium]|nr:VWA domain-containing protein [Leptospirales bacterium]
MALRKYLKLLISFFSRLIEWFLNFFKVKKKKPVRKEEKKEITLTSIYLPPENERERLSDVKRPTVPLMGEDYALDIQRKSAGDLNVNEHLLTDEEIAYARNRIRKIAQRLATTMSRNRRHSSKKLQIDFRKTMRHSIQTGGIMINLKYKARVIQKPRIAIILDASGSMQIWIKMLLQIIQAIGLELSKKEIFIFSYDLECVTKDVGKTWRDTALALKNRKTWGGTTSIFTGLQTFQSEHHDKFTTKTVVLMLSDLYTDDPMKSADEVRKIRRKTKAFYIFQIADKEVLMEEYNTYDETYVQPFRGAATATYQVTDLNSMANAIRNVCMMDS